MHFGRNIVATEGACVMESSIIPQLIPERPVGDEWKKHRKIANPAFSEVSNGFKKICVNNS